MKVEVYWGDVVPNHLGTLEAGGAVGTLPAALRGSTAPQHLPSTLVTPRTVRWQVPAAVSHQFLGPFFHP